MPKIRTLILCITLTAISFSNAFAHHYWISPETFSPKENTTVKTAFTAAHTFFTNEEIPDVTKFEMFVVNPMGRVFPLAYSRATPEAALADVAISGQGSYIVCAVSTSPGYWSQTKEDWQPGKKNEVPGAIKGWKYVKSIKTFLKCKKSSDSYDDHLGFEIEIIPQKDPSTLKSSDSLPVLVVFRGKPIENTQVSAIYEGFSYNKNKSKSPVETKTNSKGMAIIKLNKPGKWLIFAKHEEYTPKSPLADNENYRAYMMFEVK
ncbi:DUF4198 domain-containing protein [Desulfobacula phenolica]|uniref:Uncharacterized conserved protein, contains GH25 family domain n=1 Tax=Desulfobacula phenolica TaxID=90732 RepID=A0A1H2FDC6_9BACT|nr:DUF4198 domain-containing protein [Desulfobacula phenolica]SDU05370.1 Uncharacterized conserved protein, contains GH25 family domain [Desulfobacula phenolica]